MAVNEAIAEWRRLNSDMSDIWSRGSRRICHEQSRDLGHASISVERGRGCVFLLLYKCIHPSIDDGCHYITFCYVTFGCASVESTGLIKKAVSVSSSDGGEEAAALTERPLSAERSAVALCKCACCRL